MHAFVSAWPCASCGGAHDLCLRDNPRLDPGRVYRYTCPRTGLRCEFRGPTPPRLVAVGTVPGAAVILEPVPPE